VINRLLFLAAVGSIQGFAQYYLSDVLHIENPATMTTVLLGVVAVFLIGSALAGGYLADRIGRKRLVGLSGLAAAAGTLVLLFAGNLPLVLVSGSIIGVGAGTFMATNWALGTDLAPPGEAGRYLGISNLAGAGAGIVGAGIGGPMADFFNGLQPGLGYLVVFGVYGGLFLLSVAALAGIREPVRKRWLNRQTS
jgi:MFS family permease